MKKYNSIRYDYSHLKGKIIERFKSAKNFAAAVGMTNAAVSRKLNNQRYFTQNEIRRFSELLGIAETEIGFYFFSRQS